MKAQNTSDFGRIMMGLIIVVLVMAVVSMVLPSPTDATAAIRDGGQMACTSLFQEACR